MTMRTILGAALGASGVILFALTGTAYADKLDDFTRASMERNCRSIPYSSLQDECERRQQDVKDYCDQAGCADLTVGQSLTDQSSLERTLVTLASEIRELESKLSNAKTDSDKRDLDGQLVAKRRALQQSTSDLDSKKKQIEGIRIQMRGRIAKAERCRNARLEVQRVFQRALQDAERETDPAIRKIANEKLIPHWREEGVKHSEAIINTQNALDACNRRLEGRQ